MSSESDGSTSTTDTDGSTTSSTSSTEPTSSEASDFIPPPDEPAFGECDVFAQDCPDGEKCVPYATSDTWDDNKCVPVLGDQAAGEPCTSDGLAEATDDCDASSICWDVQEVDGELVGTCIQQCTGSGDAPMCPLNQSCLISGSGVIAVCMPGCDPLLQDCDEGSGCYWENTGFECSFTSGAGIPTGEPCSLINDCAPGNLCTSAATLPSCAGESCCTKFCDLSEGDTGCVEQPGTACVAIFEEGMTPDGLEDVGTCIVPG